MFQIPKPRRPEIDHRTIKLIVGVVALSLPWLTSLFASAPLQSISASYYEGGWSQSIYIGFLFAISALLLAYNGRSRTQMVLSKVASLAGLGSVLFPCGCPGHVETVPYIHNLSGAATFLVLAYFCYAFLRTAWDKGHPQAKARATVYALCGVAILVAISVLGCASFIDGALTARFPRIVFWWESVGLTAFGIAWLTASRFLPVLTRSDERFSPFRAQNPD
jgi:hypothetical protein